jgi:hypothetical protein
MADIDKHEYSIFFPADFKKLPTSQMDSPILSYTKQGQYRNLKGLCHETELKIFNKNGDNWSNEPIKISELLR